MVVLPEKEITGRNDHENRIPWELLILGDDLERPHTVFFIYKKEISKKVGEQGDSKP